MSNLINLDSTLVFREIIQSVPSECSSYKFGDMIFNQADGQTYVCIGEEFVSISPKTNESPIVNKSKSEESPGTECVYCGAPVLKNTRCEYCGKWAEVKAKIPGLV